MKPMMILFAMFAILFGCDSANDLDVDASADAGIPDASGSDAAIDAGTPDSMVADAAVPDAGCPPLVPGDMFLVASNPMKFIMNSSTRAMYFPYEFAVPGDDDGVYHSWRSSDEGLYHITQDCFDNLWVPSEYPGGVNLRPGSYVIKRPLSDQWYVVLPGNTKAKISPEIAATLYVPAYPEGVNDAPVTVHDVFWPNMVNVGADVVEARVHPGMLFMVGEGDAIYYADPDGSLREVTDAGFTANHFQQRFVKRVPLSAIAGMSLGAPIDGLVPEIDDPTQGG